MSPESKVGTVALRAAMSISRRAIVPGVAAMAMSRPAGVAAWQRTPTTLLSIKVASERSTTTSALPAMTALSSAREGGGGEARGAYLGWGRFSFTCNGPGKVRLR